MILLLRFFSKFSKKFLKEINKHVTLSKLFLIIDAFNIKSTIFPEVVFISIKSP